MTPQHKHTMKCMNYSSIQTLNRLIAEIDREDYQTASQIKGSINSFLEELHKTSKEKGYYQI